MDNISLKRCACGGDEDAIVNGGFDEGNNIGIMGSDVFPKITGWDGGKFGIEIGDGNKYNSNWKSGNRISELDSYGNTMISQIITLDSSFNVVESPQMI